MYRLVKTADVFLTNVKLSDIRKFGIEYETLSQLNPRLIYASMTGYGTKGPDKDSPGYDTAAYFARSGIYYMMQEPGSTPPGPCHALGDYPAAMGLACGIATALFVRERTGIGQEVETSLLSSGVFALSVEIMTAIAMGIERERNPRSDVINPLQNVYQTKDGRWLRLSISQPDFYWSDFCRAIGREDLAHNPSYETLQLRTKNNMAFIKILDEVFASKTLDEWKSRLGSVVPWSPLQSPPEVVEDPQARANDFFVSLNDPEHGPVEMLATPIKLSKTPATYRTLAPEFSQHTEEVLLELGYTFEDMAQLKEQGIIA